MKAKRFQLPTEAQSRILRRIAQNGKLMMLTHDDDNKDRYSDMAGVTIPTPTANRLKRWMDPQHDSLFDLKPQTWRIKELWPVKRD